MTSSNGRWAEISALFDELVELGAKHRIDRLEAIDRSEPELAAELRALLAADESASPMLGSVAADVVPGVLRREKDTVPGGGMVGPYRLSSMLGEGGMGVVWLGKRIDGAYEQQVAIKVLKRGMDSEAILRRFLQERRILARLHHPHIVRLLDGGMSADGRPYYVMDYVDGQPITLHAQQHRLGIAARVELLAKVADAVAHAHAQLVVHRDLKPSNLLIDSAGEPRVLDFGIAKLIEESGDQTMTGTGLRVMSPAYAAPEQILGEPISTATDVYSLGLMLCELLVGVLPHHRRGATPAQLVQGMAHETTDLASVLAARLADERVAELYGTGSDARQLARALSGDLDIIIASALQREPERRYASASAFAVDLRRWLDGRPIAARADSTGYRMKKFVRRHRVGVAVTAAVVLALVAGLGTALWQAQVARAEARRADSERALAQRQLARTEQVKDFMLTLFREHDPMSRARAQGRTASALIADGIGQIDSSLASEPELQAELLRDLGEIQISLGDREAATLTLSRAWEQQKTLSGDDSAESADAQAVYAAALLASGDTASAEPLLRSAIERLHATLGPDHLKTVDAEASMARIDIMFTRNDDAMRRLQHGVDVYAAVHGPDHPAVVPRLSALAALLVQMSRFEEAIATSRRALRIIERHNGPEHVRAMVPHAHIADAFRYQQKYDQALVDMQAAVRIGRSQLPEGHPVFAGVLIRLGDLLRRMKRYEEAEQVFAEGLERLEGSKTAEYAQMLQVYGTLAAARGEFELANDRFRASFDAFRAATGDSAFTWLTAMLHVESLVKVGQLAQAERLAAEAAAGLARAGSVDSYEGGYLAVVTGHLRLRQGRIAESVSQLRHALAILTRTYGEEHADVAGARFMLARSLLALGDADSRAEASRLIELALPVMQRADAEAPLLGEAHLVRAEIRLREGDRTGAVGDLEAALPLLKGRGLDQEIARKGAHGLAAQLRIKPAG